MKQIYNWWDSLSSDSRKVFDIGILCFPFHIGLGLGLYFDNFMFVAVPTLVSVFFVYLNMKFGR